MEEENNIRKLNQTLQLGMSCSWSEFFDDPQTSQMTFDKTDRADAEYFIQGLLGYLPDEKFYLPHLPFIISAYNQFKKGIVNSSTLETELVFHIKHIRNDELMQSGFNYCKAYTDEDYKYYECHLAHLKKTARDRLENLAGSPLDIENSLYAEMLLREFLNCQSLQDRIMSELTPADLKALTMYFFRSTYINMGGSHARRMDLFAEFIDFDSMKSEV
jgi:hypothetical protein